MLLGALRVSAASPSLSLPTVFDSSDLLQSCIAGPSAPNALQLEAGAIGNATNNVGSIWEISDEHQSSHVFGDSSGYALLQSSMWAEMRYRGWCVSYGRGRRDAYSGNADAAQLWIDMHAGNRTQSAYDPEANSVRVTASWYGVGRDFPIRAGNLSGTGNLSLRRVIASDYLAGAVVGVVEGEKFTGKMRSVSAGPLGGKIRGYGWAVDGQLRLRCGDRWLGQATVEGLLGQVSWDGLIVEDSQIVSWRTFTDPEGLLHDYGGISGATWRENRKARLNPYYRLDLIRTGRPHVLCGIGFQSGLRSTPNLGFAWPQRKNRWLPFVRFYPAQQRFEIGAVGQGWQVRISGDDWILSAPKHAEVSASLQALRF